MKRVDLLRTVDSPDLKGTETKSASMVASKFGGTVDSPDLKGTETDSITQKILDAERTVDSPDLKGTETSKADPALARLPTNRR